jgi:zinc transporter 1
MKSRLRIAISISFCFFVVEISFGFYTRSLALIADAFHVSFDLLSFSIALGAITVCLTTAAANECTYVVLMRH